MEAHEQELIAEVRRLARENFAPRAARHDREGSFPAENIDELRALGISGMALGKAVGGMEISPHAQMRIMEEIAYGDASTAVAINMHAIVAGFIEFFPPFPRRNAVLEDMARNGTFICGAGSVPSAELDTRTAGWRVTEDGDDLVFNGKAGFASMSEGAKYTLMGGVIDRGEGSEPDVAIAIPELNSPGLKLMHNWDAMGLRGTASHDIVAEGLRVPKAEAMVVPIAMLRMIQQAQAQVVSVPNQLRARHALGITAIWLGLAQAAFDFTLGYVGKRYGYLAGPNIGNIGAVGFRSEQAWAQMGIGNMEHWLETGRVVLDDGISRLSTPFASTQEFTRHLVRTVYHLRRMSEEVSAGAMKVCGAHAYVKASPLERIFRDMVGGNVMAWKTDELQLALGQGALGLPISFVGPAGT
jgi:alkylation response protein AidB-like acyl-CoA dehydrogenase